MDVKKILILAFFIGVVALIIYAINENSKKNKVREAGSSSADIIKNLMGN